MYNKDSERILDFAEEFIKENNKLFNFSEGDTVFVNGGGYTREKGEITTNAIYNMKRSENFCFGSMVLSAEVVFKAKDGKSRGELNNIKYFIIPPGGKSKCSGGGDYQELKASDCCKRVDYIEQYMNGKFEQILIGYKRKLKASKDRSSWSD